LSLEQLRAAARRAQAAAAEAAEVETAKKPVKGAAAKPARSAKPGNVESSGGSHAKRHLMVGALVLIAMIPAALMILPKLKTGTPAKTGSVTIERPADGNRLPVPPLERSAPAAKDRGAAVAPELAPNEIGADLPVVTPAAHPAGGENEDQEHVEAAAPDATAPAPAPIETASIDRVSTGLAGVSVQEPARTLTAQEIVRLRNQAQMAHLSGQLGAAQGRAPFAEQVAQQASAFAAAPGPTPAKSVTTTAANSAPIGQSAQEIGAAAAGLELPPAAVGPLSLRIAAAKGDPSAQFEVAARFAEGKGIAQDFKQALAWYQRSATLGLAQAQYRLGTLFERGLGTTVDLTQARIWYQRAAEQGSTKAMHNLAVLSAGRDAGTPDYTAAAQWFQQAAERGLPDSQFNLAVLNENGLGVPKDLAHAYKWYALAAASGDKESARRRDLLKSKLAGPELVQAEALVKGFRAKPADRAANDARVAGEAWKSRQAAAAAN
jgi:localization factor PodJL